MGNQKKQAHCREAQRRQNIEQLIRNRISQYASAAPRRSKHAPAKITQTAGRDRSERVSAKQGPGGFQTSMRDAAFPKQKTPHRHPHSEHRQRGEERAEEPCRLQMPPRGPRFFVMQAVPHSREQRQTQSVLEPSLNF